MPVSAILIACDEQTETKAQQPQKQWSVCADSGVTKRVFPCWQTTLCLTV